MARAKIHGAGSIGNHLAHACRVMGWQVDLCDVDAAALERTRHQIYPTRYGKWDEAIGLHRSADAPRGGYDVIFVGTPPSSHIGLALDALGEGPRALHIEKPLCPPDLSQAQELFDRSRAAGIPVFVGYNHVVAPCVVQLESALRGEGVGTIETLDVEFREHWGGIFAAHPWLRGPADSYLGFSERGGGASGEHSHALNLWQHLAHVVGAGRVVEVSAAMDVVTAGGARYDKLCGLHLRAESGLRGRCVQDVVTDPPRKWGRVQGSRGFAEFFVNYEPGRDVTRVRCGEAPAAEANFPKTRPDDFIVELKHMADVMRSGAASPIGLERGLDTMLVLAAAHRSAEEGRTIRLDYSKGYVPAALG